MPSRDRELSGSLERAMALAQEYRSRAYAPYSAVCIGAVLLTQSHDVIGAANVENASFGLTMCAERAAVAAAVAAGQREFVAIAIAGPSDVATAPCGACRQVLSEFNARMVVAYTAPSGVQITTLDKLLPDAFAFRNRR